MHIDLTFEEARSYLSSEGVLMYHVFGGCPVEVRLKLYRVLKGLEKAPKVRGFGKVVWGALDYDVAWRAKPLSKRLGVKPAIARDCVYLSSDKHVIVESGLANWGPTRVERLRDVLVGKTFPPEEPADLAKLRQLLYEVQSAVHSLPTGSKKVGFDCVRETLEVILSERAIVLLDPETGVELG